MSTPADKLARIRAQRATSQARRRALRGIDAAAETLARAWAKGVEVGAVEDCAS